MDRKAEGHLPAHVLDRVKASKGRFRGDFFERDESGNPVRILCRVCSTEIAGWTPGTQNRSDVKVPMFFIHHNNFRIVQLKLSDGSNYRTNCCVDCVDKIDVNDPDDLEDLYCSDIEGWARAAKASAIAKEDHARGFERMHGLSVTSESKKILRSGDAS